VYYISSTPQGFWVTQLVYATPLSPAQDWIEAAARNCKKSEFRSHYLDDRMYKKFHQFAEGRS